MADAIVHRGPDDSGDWLSADGRIGFAHRRLSIVDLTNRGRQPMTDFNNRFTIVFNGEIYNYNNLYDNIIINDNLLNKNELLDNIKYEINNSK